MDKNTAFEITLSISGAVVLTVFCILLRQVLTGV